MWQDGQFVWSKCYLSDWHQIPPYCVNADSNIKALMINEMIANL